VIFLQQPPPGGDQADFVPRLKKPVLTVNGRYDYTFPPEESPEPRFRMSRAPVSEKSRVVLDTPLDVTEQRPRLIQEVLGWFDRYPGAKQLIAGSCRRESIAMPFMVRCGPC
jgi:eukaryotic-like serine/threonine-protein kinase